jgi:hypothetical protein
MDMPGILLPLLALVGWTLLVLLLIPFHRFRAAFAGKVTAEDFRFGESERVPPEVSIPNRNYMNLLEAPVLFYAVGLIYAVAQKGDAVAIAFAWAYVALRVVQSVIHLSYNNVFHRLGVFATSNIVLLVLWARLALACLR